MDTTQQIEIDSGIDMPPLVKREKTFQYPWSRMKSGDSFLMPCEGHDVAAMRAKVTGNARYRGLTIQTRTEPGGLRVWLI